MVDEILDLYQGFLSTWGHMLSFSVTGGTEKIVGFWFAWGGEISTQVDIGFNQCVFMNLLT